MIESWYSRSYLGRSFDRFLESEMNSKDFQLLQAELQSVLVQLQESKRFTESGFQNRIGGTRTKQNVRKGMYS